MSTCHVRDNASRYMRQQPNIGDECSMQGIMVKDTIRGGTVRVCTRHGYCKTDGSQKRSNELNLVRDMFAPGQCDYKLKCNGCRAKHAFSIVLAPIAAIGAGAAVVVAGPAAIVATGGAHAVVAGTVNAACNAGISALIPGPAGAILGSATNLH